MAYATTNDLKRMVEKVMELNRYHIIITKLDENRNAIVDCYGQGITTSEVVNAILNKGDH